MNWIFLANPETRAKVVGLALLLALPVVVLLFPLANQGIGDIYLDAEARETQQLQSRSCHSGNREYATDKWDWLSWFCGGSVVRQLVHKQQSASPQN